MDRKIFILISVACIILTASANAVATIGETAPGNASQKIDPALADRFTGREDEKIPVIVMLNGAASPNLDDFAVKYKYSLIHGLAGDASPQTIERMAETSLKQSISPRMYVNFFTASTISGRNWDWANKVSTSPCVM